MSVNPRQSEKSRVILRCSRSVVHNVNMYLLCSEWPQSLQFIKLSTIWQWLENIMSFITSNNLLAKHGIIHKPSASIRFWLKAFHKKMWFQHFMQNKLCVIFDIFYITNYLILTISGHSRITEYMIQLQTIAIAALY